MSYKFNFAHGSSLTSGWLEEDSSNLIIMCSPENSPDQCFFLNPSIHRRSSYLRARLGQFVQEGRSHMYSWRGKIYIVSKIGYEINLRWSSLSSISDKEWSYSYWGNKCMGNKVIFSHEENCEVLFSDVTDAVPIADDTGVNFFLVAGREPDFQRWVIVYRYTFGNG
ncbi:Oidioi.mRNA.OKI2018_I69.chr2.g8233.t1.cds [Oikopleura dioica]|uniref:Oidioi.mRNA.OKI2018_I69.chr2.g8233.t1.cds n=1 Tax=Oikopleura dioica TaxID=34765 RepID=A0ABN7TAW4_OIKDI|nr:Oidioi.mRNA.OKI2018_I69.chr2.g8233.t1.cds [Oikopleura dioica]